MKKNNYVSKIFKCIFIYMIMLVTFLSMLYLQALIPQEKIEENVKESSEYFNNKIYKFIGIKSIVLDNWSDAVIVNTAYSIDSKKPLESIMLDRRSYDPNRELIEIDSKINSNNNENPVRELKECLEKNNKYYYQYARYWHGYLIIIRPLLVFFNSKQIGILYEILLIILAIIMAYFIIRKIGKKECVIFIFSLVFFSYYCVGLCLHYASVQIISMLFSLYVVKKKKISPYCYFIVGGLTSFFDLSTVPLVTLGMPLIFEIMFNDKNTEHKKIFKNIFMWGIGYVSIWGAKWILADLIVKNNIIYDAFLAFKVRSGGKNISFFEILFRNSKFTIIEFIILFLSSISIFLISLKNGVKIIKKEYLQYFFISLLPLIWYMLVQNHSYIHYFFTYRNLIISFFSIGIIDVKIISDLFSKKS